MIERNIDLNASLIEAVISEDINLVLSLIERGADVNYENEVGQTPLLLAVIRNNAEMIETIAGTAKLTHTFSVNTALMWSYMQEDEVVKDLLFKNASLISDELMKETQLYVEYMKEQGISFESLVQKFAEASEAEGLSEIDYEGTILTFRDSYIDFAKFDLDRKNITVSGDQDSYSIHYAEL